MVYIDSNCIFNFLGENKLRIYHPFYRRNVLVTSNFASFLDDLTDGIEKNALVEKMSRGEGFGFTDATEFDLWEGMYRNPDFYTAQSQSIALKKIAGEELIKNLLHIGILTLSQETVYEFKKSNLLDRYKGNINEQIATEALYRRVPISEWWMQQKFTEDKKELKDTPYRYSQDLFLRKYFKDHLKGKDVLEVGCGTGYYTNQMADHACHVYGLDYERKYIEQAQARTQGKGNAHFFLQDILQPFSEDALGSKQFDYVFMIDIFLFLFDNKFQSKLVQNRDKIMKQVKSVLKQDGVLVILDPHLFWLTPRFGQAQTPYGIITEYRERHFGVIPTLEVMSEVFYQSGLVIRKILEPSIDKEYEKIDPQGYHFIRQFPQWIVFELVRGDHGEKK